ncbi:hypothetical protein PIB30_040304 [Stylosanthes scabra]|uniref:Uncharacterized protein n=1 Tax=Stylosanthes scabra TaxID=79078 RepID=A0ABU6QG20_9FABA|nr:hypothetical protein [Stylosanthes scabra]
MRAKGTGRLTANLQPIISNDGILTLASLMYASSSLSTFHPYGGQSLGGTNRNTEFSDFERFNGFESFQKHFFAFVETFPSKTGFGSEDFLPWRPTAINPVLCASFVFSFCVLGDKVLGEGFVEGKLVGGEAFEGRVVAVEVERP